MEIENKHILIAFFVLTMVLGFTLVEINAFMPKLSLCDDDFAVIETCNCLPWNQSVLYPDIVKKQELELPYG